MTHNMTDKFVSGFVGIRFGVGGCSISAVIFLPATRGTALKREPLTWKSSSVAWMALALQQNEKDVNKSDMVASDACTART